MNFSNICSIINQLLHTEELYLAQCLDIQDVLTLEVPAEFQLEQLLWHIGCDAAWNAISCITIKIVTHLRIINLSFLQSVPTYGS